MRQVGRLFWMGIAAATLAQAQYGAYGVCHVGHIDPANTGMYSPPIKNMQITVTGYTDLVECYTLEKFNCHTVAYEMYLARPEVQSLKPFSHHYEWECFELDPGERVPAGDAIPNWVLKDWQPVPNQHPGSNFVRPEPKSVPVIFPGPNGIPLVVPVDPNGSTYRFLNEINRILDQANPLVEGLIMAILLVTVIAVLVELIGALPSGGGTILLPAPTMALAGAAILAICATAGIQVDANALNPSQSRASLESFEVEPNHYQYLDLKGSVRFDVAVNPAAGSAVVGYADNDGSWTIDTVSLIRKRVSPPIESQQP